MTQTPSRKRPSSGPTPLAVFGAGHLVRALLPLLPGTRYAPVVVYARRLAAARSACRLVHHGRARATTRLESALDGASLVLLAVPDREIAPLADRLARLRESEWKGRVVLHHAGSAGPDLLAPLARKGASVAVLHPLQCLGDPALASSLLPGSRARIEGDRRARQAAAHLARTLGLIPLRFPASPTRAQRSAYHAAASLLSNDVVALLSLGLELMEKAGVDRGPALEGLVALARGTLLQAGRRGISGALTGPVPRGDVETLQAQLERLRPLPGAAEIHRLLSLRMARLARARGNAPAAARVERALDGPSGPRGTGAV